MRLMYFKDENWVELENYDDFDTFYEEIALEERAFKFIDSTIEDIEGFFLKMEKSSGGLDDCDYYSFDCDCDFDGVDTIFIFDELSLFTLDGVIHRHEVITSHYRDIKDQLEEGF